MMRVEEAQKRLDEISETIKELQAYGSDIARAKRAIAHEQIILEGVSRKRDPVPWAIAQFRLAAALTVTAAQASDIPGLRKAAYRLEKARRIFQHAGHKDAVQKCEEILAIIKKQLVKLGDDGDLFDPEPDLGGGGKLGSRNREYANDLADRLRQAAGHIDRDAARRSARALRDDREREELAAREARQEREQARQHRERSHQRQRDWDRDR